MINFVLQSENEVSTFLMKLKTDKWIEFFKCNQENRPEPRWQEKITITGRQRQLLEQSIREFQLGDGGGPACLIAWNEAQWRNSLSGLAEVVDLWFTEEKGHARLLGRLLERFKVQPISGHWSFALFCSVRRWSGVAFELQVLTLTELSSTVYYRLLRKHGEDLGLRDVCSLILRDESGHLAFQNARIFGNQTGWPKWLRQLWRAQFWFCGFLAATVLWLSHGACLRSLGATTQEFFREIIRQFSRFTYRLEHRHRRE